MFLVISLLKKILETLVISHLIILSLGLKIPTSKGNFAV